jgi:hypothetical protein
MFGEFIAHDLKFPVWSLNHGPLADLNTASCRLPPGRPQRSAFRGEAEVSRETKPADSVENDPMSDIDGAGATCCASTSSWAVAAEPSVRRSPPALVGLDDAADFSLRQFCDCGSQLVRQVDHDIVPAGHFDNVPAGRAGIFLGEITKRARVPSISQNIEPASDVLDLAR